MSFEAFIASAVVTSIFKELPKPCPAGTSESLVTVVIAPPLIYACQRSKVYSLPALVVFTEPLW